jgi:hypothetical protein
MEGLLYLLGKAPPSPLTEGTSFVQSTDGLRCVQLLSAMSDPTTTNPAVPRFGTILGLLGLDFVMQAIVRQLSPGTLTPSFIPTTQQFVSALEAEYLSVSGGRPPVVTDHALHEEQQALARWKMEVIAGLMIAKEEEESKTGTTMSVSSISTQQPEQQPAAVPKYETKSKADRKAQRPANPPTRTPKIVEPSTSTPAGSGSEGPEAAAPETGSPRLCAKCRYKRVGAEHTLCYKCSHRKCHGEYCESYVGRDYTYCYPCRTAWKSQGSSY